MLSASECQATVQHSCTLWRSYAGLMTDGPHWFFELTVEVMTAPVALVIGRAWGRREHKRIDAEHGVTHDAPVKPEPVEKIDTCTTSDLLKRHRR